MFWNIFLLETDKMFKRMTFWIELIVLALVIVLIDLAQYGISRITPAQASTLLVKEFTWPVGLVNAASFADAHALGGILLIILVGAVTAREYSWRTFHLWLSHGISRPLLLGAKFVVSLLAIVMIVLTSLLISGCITAILTFAVGAPFQLSQIDPGAFFVSILITCFGLLPYVALTFMLAILSRSAALAIGVGLAFIFLVEGTMYGVLSFVGGATTAIVQYLPVGLENALRYQGASIPRGGTFPPPAIAVLSLALYTVLFCGLAMWRFQRQNFTD